MKKLLLLITFLFMTIPLFAGQGKVRVACDEKGAYIYVDGKKKAMTGEGFTNILLEEGDHTIKVLKAKNRQYQRYVQKEVFVGAETSIKITFKLDFFNKKNIWEPTLSYRNVLQTKDIPKLQRFQRNGSVVNDIKLRLMWQDDYAAKTTQYSWSEAKSYCSNLSLAGYSDWRLPTYNELVTIVDYDRYQPAIMPSFKNIVSNDFEKNYWSSTSYNSKEARGMEFRYGFSGGGSKSEKNFVRCIRDK
jgi:hypothetical protein